jgi:hypothetical protein
MLFVAALLALAAPRATAAASTNTLTTYGTLTGRRFRAGDTLLIILRAPGYLPERALVKIRNGRLPQTKLLPD